MNFLQNIAYSPPTLYLNYSQNQFLPINMSSNAPIDKIGNNEYNSLHNYHQTNMLYSQPKNMMSNKPISKIKNQYIDNQPINKKNSIYSKYDDDESQDESMSYEGVTSELQFSVIKDELYDMVYSIIDCFLNGKFYEENKVQYWCNDISEEIIKALHQQQRGFKFICNTTIFQKEDFFLHYSSTCLWNPNTDGSITVRYENDEFYCFVSLFGIAP